MPREAKIERGMVTMDVSVQLGAIALIRMWCGVRRGGRERRKPGGVRDWEGGEVGNIRTCEAVFCCH